MTEDTTARPFLPFAVPDIGEDEIAEVVDTLRSGWVTTGPKARRFEEAFAAWLAAPPLQPLDDAGAGALQAVAVNSATAGLHLALEALGSGAGDEVIVPTHTFTATAEVVRYLGADVRLVDVDADTLNIDPDAVAAALTPATRAIVPVHFAGLAADMKALHAIASLHDLKVVEDAAHALPTTCDGETVGTLARSDATVFSFYATKTITTGEGGMLVTRDEALAARARTMRLHGMSRDAFDRYTARAPSWYYEVVAPGYKYNLTDIAAALGLQQLKRAHAFRLRRAQIAAQYDAAFVDLPLVAPPRARDRFVEKLYEAGIGCSVHFIPLHLHPYWRDRYDLSPERFPASQDAYERTVSLPIHTRMSDDDVSRVIDAVRGQLAL